MFQLYIGLVPGEAPIDRLVDGVIADPALAPEFAAPDGAPLAAHLRPRCDARDATLRQAADR